MDRDPAVAGRRASQADPASGSLSLRRRLLRGNGHIITAVVILIVFAVDAFSVSLNVETATARVAGQAGSEGLRDIQIEFEFDGERHVESVHDDRELAEGEELEIWFSDPGFVYLSRSDLFLGSYLVIGLALIYLAIAVVRRVRRRAAPS